MSSRSLSPSKSNEVASSTPSIRDCVTLDSLDARILQYRYGTQKILKVLENVKSMIKKCSQDNQIPFTKYIILLNGSIFNVNDNIYRRSEILINGNKFNPAQSIDPTTNTNAVNFDCMDNSTNYDTTKLKLPTYKESTDILKLLELLLFNTFEIYNQKWKTAMKERSMQESKRDKPFLTLEDIVDLLQFAELESIENMTEPSLQDPGPDTSVEAHLRSLDLKSLNVNITNFEKALDQIAEEVDKLGQYKVKDNLLSSPHYKFVLPRAFLLLLHLADFYGVVRKFGKMIYHNNSFYFDNYTRTNDSLRTVLRNLNVYFNQAKKNSLLLSLIAKITRNGSVMTVRPDNINELHRVCDDSLSLLKTMLLVLKRFQAEWQAIIDSNRSNEYDKVQLRLKLKQQAIKERNDLKRRSTVNTSQLTRNLEALYVDPEKDKLEKEKQSKLQKELFDEAKEARLLKEVEQKELEIQRAEEMQQKVGDREKQLRDELRSNGSSPNSLSRQSSVSRSRSSSNQSNQDDGSLRRTKSTSSRRNSLLVTPEPQRVIQVDSESRSDTSSPVNSFTSPTPTSALAGATASLRPLFRHQQSPVHPSQSPPVNQNAKAAALASRKAVQQPLTAQQRLQQHIFKSSQSGQTIVKKLEPRVISKPIYATSSATTSSNSVLEVPKLASPSDSRTSSIQSESEFPTSPLNSLKQSSLPEFQLQTNRSRSGSLQGEQAQTSSYVTPAFRASPSASASRSRSGSLSQRSVEAIPEDDEKTKTSDADTTLTGGENSPVKIRSRASSTRQNGPPRYAGNILVVPEDAEPQYDADGELIKKVRFTGVAEYSEDEDAPTPQQMQKQMRQKWSSYKPLFRNRTKQLNSQEGMAFRKFQGSLAGAEFEGFNKVNSNAIPVDANGKFSMMSVINSPESAGGPKKLTKLFKRR
ncbi:hypothetical protein OGAPHI_004418 [Ogataea philodendri]|uniref:Uncharacterized protein n=2 Tax=Saccharomycotina TaxID=147537 RepID=A0A9P8T5E6_9ASCO|nr:uncharacterized protein OGAPHI_004418 [Ogataea philodendri]KAH3666229.1 hypothetical protein OGAPHI_004418 [Ogataea philodendri]